MKRLCFFLFGILAALTVFPGSALPEAASAIGYVISANECGKAGCYWETPMDISNPDMIWQMLIAPITVVEGHEKTQVYLYEKPDEESTPLGEVTCATQGVHVLEHLKNGWSRVECYSSSFFDSKLKAWNQLVEGYLPTELLMEIEVKQNYGLVADKLSQRLYVFYQGELLDTLAISTGKPTEKQPYNETRSGEFILSSRIGDFVSDDMICPMGIRFNNGDLLHQVPYIPKADGTKYYGSRETMLGQRASHGCIRVQRKRTPSGMNMSWLWKNLAEEMGTRLVVWEDAPGRTLPYPSDDTPLYYYPSAGRYHRENHCYSTSADREPTERFLYKDLDTEPYAKMEMCISCYPPLRKGEIDQINEALNSGASQE